MTARRLRRVAVAGAAAWIALVVTMALFRSVLAGPVADGSMHLVPFDPDAVQLQERLTAPGGRHWLGTDELGRDVLSRLIHGAFVSLFVSVAAVAVALLAGVILGALAGYFGGAADWVVSRAIEVAVCFPFLFLLLAIVAVFPPSALTIVIALAATSWPDVARLVRSEMLRLRESDFAQAARASGAGHVRVVVRHLLPHAASPVIVAGTFGIAFAILLESAISFLGFGVPLPTASWGMMLSGAERYLHHAWWLSVAPGVAITLTVLSFNTLGEALRRRLDPRR